MPGTSPAPAGLSTLRRVTTPTAPRPVDRSVPALVVAVLVGYALLAYAAVAPGLNLAGALLGLVLTLGILGIQLGYVSRPGVRGVGSGTVVALLALACLVYVPVVALGVGWIAFAGFLAGSLLVLLPPPVGYAGSAVVVVSVALLAFGAGAPVLATATVAVGTAVTGLVVHGLTRLREITAERRPATPVEAEEEAEEEVDEAVHDEAVDEVDGAAAGEEAPADARPAPLADALRAARAQLDDAGVELSVLGEDVELPEDVATPFAALLRVAVGHAGRHPAATSCRVTIVRRGSEARIVVTHDGATDDPDPDDFETLGTSFDDRDGAVLAERDDEEFTVDGRLPLTT